MLLRRVAEPFMEDLDEDLVGAFADDFDKGISAFGGEPKGGGKQDREYGLVLPAVQAPLMFVEPDGMAEEGFGIADGPEVAHVWAARAEVVAEQVEMKRQQAQEEYPPMLPGENHEQCRDGEGTRPAMQEDVVILLIILKGVWLAGDPRADDIGDYTESISIRQDTGPRHQFAVPWIIGGCGGNEPAANEVGQG